MRKLILFAAALAMAAAPVLVGNALAGDGMGKGTMGSGMGKGNGGAMGAPAMAAPPPPPPPPVQMASPPPPAHPDNSGLGKGNKSKRVVHCQVRRVHRDGSFTCRRHHMTWTFYSWSRHVRVGQNLRVVTHFHHGRHMADRITVLR